jgi:hypothetical protein
MDESIHDDEALLRYLNNELDPDERRKLDLQLQNDAALRRKLESLQVSMEAIKQLGNMEMVKGIHKEMMQELRPKQRAPVRKMVRRTLTVAAAVILLIVVSAAWWFYQLSPEDVYKQHYRPYVVAISRAAADKDRITTLFANRNYQEVTARSATSSLSGPDSLLVAISFLETGKSAEAVRWFKALQAGSSQFRHDADYYLSFAYLKNKEYSQALQLMNEIRSDSDHLYSRQISIKLLRRVRMLQWKYGNS